MQGQPTPWDGVADVRPPAGAARTYAAYGGVYIGVALVWLWVVEGERPSAWDIAGALVALAGMAIIVLAPRK
ncbi:YnfA family protein [Stigmatella sp. ncwal1]|uniref:YnfA family protein n=1 Tax=Stigmatella ashevillensis TaxID=2995309 RepID=A0ABT5D272_9BACT|nr:YnfA family protein [Stigmatella ashevillena]MDC0707233.1 YnfA family protein [Stigmatella ashevillena]